jgi:hypothetical protein
MSVNDMEEDDILKTGAGEFERSEQNDEDKNVWEEENVWDDEWSTENVDGEEMSDVPTLTELFFILTAAGAVDFDLIS